MPEYAILLYSPAPADPAEVPPEEIEAQIKFGARVEDLGGKIHAPMALQSSAASRSVRGAVITDGPFIEAKEVIAGIFVLEARDMDHALEIARECPNVWNGGVEVRPIFERPTD